MSRLWRAAVAGAFLLLPAVPAYAGETGSIDHIETGSSTVKMLFSVPTGKAPDLGSVSVEVDGAEVDATAAQVEAGQIRRTAVLALDTSQSMRGSRFEAAKNAALTYLEAAPDDVSIGLVTFARDVAVVDSPTADHAALEAAVRRLRLSQGTSLYDGVLESLVQVGSEGQRDVIVLSDGADTTSTPIGDVVTEAEHAGVNVNVVALQQSPAARAKLRRITDASDGAVLVASDPKALAAVFEKEADALAQQVIVEFVAPATGEATVTASLAAAGQTYTDSTFAELVGRPASMPTSRAPIPVGPPSTPADKKLLYAGVGILGVGLASMLALLLVGRPKERQVSLAERQLDFYSRGSRPPAQEMATAPKSPIDVRGSAVALAGQIVQKAGFEERMTQRLTAAGLSLTTAEWLLLHAGIAILGALAGLLLGGAFAMLLLLALGAIGPYLFLGMQASRRRKAFGSQLPDTLQLMSGGLSAGLSLPQAVDTVVREGSEPMAGELRRALVEQRLGVEIEDALDGVGDRMGSKDFAWVVMAIRIQREVGGNLAELLDTVSRTIREREYLRRQVKTLSAEGRLSGWILGGLPLTFVLYLALTRPEYLQTMYTTTIGWMMTAAAAVLMTLGALVMRAVVKVEV
jgi:tight adherence protein B